MSEQTKREVLRDLEERLERAVQGLGELAADSTHTTSNHARLIGKRQGVQLALSYVREITR